MYSFRTLIISYTAENSNNLSTGGVPWRRTRLSSTENLSIKRQQNKTRFIMSSILFRTTGTTQ